MHLIEFTRFTDDRRIDKHRAIHRRARAYVLDYQEQIARKTC